MTFTSLKFLLFFPAVVLLYNIVPNKFKLWYLLAVSIGFYAMMQPVYLILLAIVTGLTYGFTRWMEKTEDDDKKHRLMVLAIILVVLPLFFFKYYNFANESIFGLLKHVGCSSTLPAMKWMLPVGISFYTFMAIGYIIDVYNEEVDVEHNPGSVGLFLSFFPYILSGPIERAGNIFPQLKQLKNSDPDDLISGMKMMVWGYFMKLCVADRLSIYVDAIFNNITRHNGISLFVATLMYPIQLYADFAGYSILAMGVAKCFGVKIVLNFNRPFFATSFAEFWRRWHMSLISWLTDYIYTPLTFALRNWKTKGIVIGLILTFLISGIWHGAAITFIIWGIIHGCLLIVETLLQNKRRNVESKFKLKERWYYSLFCSIVVFVVFSFTQVLGRCSVLADSISVFVRMFTVKGDLFVDIPTFAHAIPSLFILFIYDLKQEYGWKVYSMKTLFGKCLVYSCLIAYILLFGVLDNSNFIYFQF